jgi:hypothetical protein
VERIVPGIRGLSFADDIAWWAKGRGEHEVADRLAEVAEAAIKRVGNNGIAFDQGKTEAAFFRRRCPPVSEH